LLLTVTCTNGLNNTGLKLVCNVNIVYGNLKSENSQDDAQKHQRNFTFMNSASEVEFLDVIGEKSLKSFTPCYSVTSTNGLRKSGLKLVCNVNIVYGNLKCANSQDYAQKTQRSCTFMN
jgi:hypothetical protein